MLAAEGERREVFILERTASFGRLRGGLRAHNGGRIASVNLE